MNHSARIAAIIALLALAGCGGQKPAGESPGTTPATSAPTATGSGGGTVAKVSKYDAGPRAGESPADHEAAERGEKLFQVKGCSACHAFGRKMSGPDLAGVSMRRTAVWMEHQILTPDVMVKEDPIAHELFAKHALQMPKQGLTPAEAKDVIEFLKYKDAKGASETKGEGSR
jgi:mono/diheme cytochrome c family protein